MSHIQNNYNPSLGYKTLSAVPFIGTVVTYCERNRIVNLLKQTSVQDPASKQDFINITQHAKDFAIAGLIRSVLTGMMGIAILVAFITVRPLNPFFVLGMLFSVVCLSSVPFVVKRIFEIRKIEKIETKLQDPGDPIDAEFRSLYRWLLTKMDGCWAAW